MKGVWGGLVPDFVDARAREVFGGYHGKTFLDAGVDGFKLDECDNSDYTGGWSFPELSRFPSGVDGEQMHSVFGLRYQDAMWAQFKARKRETYGLVRSSGALAAPYPFVLYSDLYDHRQFIRALVNSSFSGLLWCPEVRDAVNEEDLIRRLQAVMFSPLAMVNGWYITNPPWKQIDRKKNNAGELFCGLASAGGALPRDHRLAHAVGALPAGGICKVCRRWHSAVSRARAGLARSAGTGQGSMMPGWSVIGCWWLRCLRASPAGRFLMPPGGWHDFWTGQAHSPVDQPAGRMQANVTSRCLCAPAACMPLAPRLPTAPRMRMRASCMFASSATARVPSSCMHRRRIARVLSWDASRQQGEAQQSASYQQRSGALVKVHPLVARHEIR